MNNKTNKTPAANREIDLDLYAAVSVCVERKLVFQFDYSVRHKDPTYVALAHFASVEGVTRTVEIVREDGAIKAYVELMKRDPRQVTEVDLLLNVAEDEIALMIRTTHETLGIGDGSDMTEFLKAVKQKIASN